MFRFISRTSLLDVQILYVSSKGQLYLFVCVGWIIFLKGCSGILQSYTIRIFPKHQLHPRSISIVRNVLIKKNCSGSFFDKLIVRNWITKPHLEKINRFKYFEYKYLWKLLFQYSCLFWPLASGIIDPILWYFWLQRQPQNRAQYKISPIFFVNFGVKNPASQRNW